MNTRWIRQCQECGWKNITNPPNKEKELSDKYRNAKCASCGSIGLDYGKYEEVDIHDNPRY